MGMQFKGLQYKGMQCNRVGNLHPRVANNHTHGSTSHCVELIDKAKYMGHTLNPLFTRLSQGLNMGTHTGSILTWLRQG